jgi:hypothetical protein
LICVEDSNLSFVPPGKYSVDKTGARYGFSPTEIAGNSTCRIKAAIFGTSSVLS